MSYFHFMRKQNYWLFSIFIIIIVLHFTLKRERSAKLCGSRVHVSHFAYTMKVLTQELPVPWKMSPTFSAHRTMDILNGWMICRALHGSSSAETITHTSQHAQLAVNNVAMFSPASNHTLRAHDANMPSSPESGKYYLYHSIQSDGEPVM